MTLTWKSSLTDRDTRIFRGKLIAGLLKTSLWKSEAYGELDGYLLRFKDKGFWKRTTEIQDINGNQVFGQIEYGKWRSTAKITYEQEVYEWKFGSWTRRSWSVTSGGQHADFKLKGFWEKEGEIENEDIPAAVILASLYARLHYKKMAAAVSAAT